MHAQTTPTHARYIHSRHSLTYALTHAHVSHSGEEGF